MTIESWLQAATTQLAQAGIATARLDSLVLLEDQTGRNRAWLLAHPEATLTNVHLTKLNSQLAERAQHTPLAYIRGYSEFYGRQFIVDSAVLEPRPETETMIDLLKKLPLKHTPQTTIADIGTGSGAIAITSALECPNITVIASDNDPHCLKIARQNAAKHNTSIIFYQGDLLLPLTAYRLPLTAILANLPYVPDSHTINQAAMNEPHQAIFGGPDGLDIYRRLFAQIASRAHQPAYILTEALPFQHAELARIAASSAYHLDQTDDFIQLFIK